MDSHKNIWFRMGSGLIYRTRPYDTVFLMSIGVLLAWSLTSSTITNTELGQYHLAMLGRIFIIMAAFRIILSNSYTIGLSLVSLMLALLALAVNLHTSGSQAAGESAQFIVGVINYALGVSPHTPAYEAALLWLLAVITSLFVAISTFVRFNFFMLLGVSVFVVGLSLGHGLYTYPPAFYAFAFATLVNLIKQLNIRGNKQAAGPNLMFYSLPLAALCIALAAAIPKPAPGFAESFTQSFIAYPLNNINHALYMALRPRTFTLAQTGFGMGNDRRLGGDVRTNNDVVMHIRAAGPVYLTGNVLDIYTGYSWQNGLSDEPWQILSEPVINIGLHERATSPLTALLISQGQLQQTIFQTVDYWQGLGASARALMDWSENGLLVNIDALERSHMYVHIGEHSTFTAFHTGILSGIEGMGEDIAFLQNPNGTILSNELMPGGFVYRVEYYYLPPIPAGLTYQEEDGSFLSFSRRGVLREALVELRRLEQSYEDFSPSSVLVSHGGRGLAFYELLERYLIPYSDWVYSVYTALPQAFTPRVAELAQSITYGASNNYARAIMIRDFLLQFPYTLTPGNLPQGRDFVDHFLFDVFAGYCTHFASAFVTMMRSLGVPARYVEGFNVSGTPDENGFIPVSNNQGHAWGEVYLEGFGWHKFEATPGGGGVQYTPEALYEAPAEPAFAGTAHYDDNLSEGWWGGLEPEASQNFIATSEQQAPGLAENNEQGTASALGLAAAAIAASIILAITGRVAWPVRDRRKTQSNNEAVVAGYYALIRYMYFLDMEISASDTPMGVARRLSRRPDLAEGLAIHEVVQVFLKARYSGQSIDDAERGLVENALKAADAKLRKHLGSPRYALHKYILASV